MHLVLDGFESHATCACNAWQSQPIPRAMHPYPRSDTYVPLTYVCDCDELMMIGFGVVMHAWLVLSWSNRTSRVACRRCIEKTKKKNENHKAEDHMSSYEKFVFF
jgi:hypothetical protein